MIDSFIGFQCTNTWFFGWWIRKGLFRWCSLPGFSCSTSNRT